MVMTRHMWTVAVCAGLAFGAVQHAAAAQSPKAPSAAVDAPLSEAAIDDVVRLSAADLGRIRRALNHESGLLLDSRQLRFYLEVVEFSVDRGLNDDDAGQIATARTNALSHREMLTAMAPRNTSTSAGGVSFDPVVIKNAITGFIRHRQALATRARIVKELEAIADNQRAADGSPR